MIPASSPGADLEQLGLEAALLGPAELHPEHHLRPVLGVGAAGAGVDRDERVAGVVATREEAGLLEREQALLDRREVGLDLGGERRILVGQLDEPLQLAGILLERPEGLQAAGRPGVLCRDLAGRLGVLPEARLPHLGFELGDPRIERGRVKDSPRAATAGHGRQRGAAVSARMSARWPSPTRVLGAAGHPRPSPAARQLGARIQIRRGSSA